MHGGTRTERALEFRRLSAAGQAAIDAAVADPNLLDVRRPIAVAQAIVQDSPIIPLDEDVRHYAKRRIVKVIGFELVAAMMGAARKHEDVHAVLTEMLEPTPEDLADARLDMAQRNMALVAAWSKRQVDAGKFVEWSKVVGEMALPLFTDFGVAATAILRKHVPSDRLEAAVKDLRDAIMVTVGRIATMRDEGQKR